MNKDYPEENGAESNKSFSRKIKADIFIDDRNIGGLPDWGQIYRMITNHETWADKIAEASASAQLSDDAPKRKHWWSRK